MPIEGGSSKILYRFLNYSISVFGNVDSGREVPDLKDDVMLAYAEFNLVSVTYITVHAITFLHHVYYAITIPA